MVRSHLRVCGIAVALAVILSACGGGGGEPGLSPQAGNSPDTKLHPEAYVERWWPACGDKPCAATTAQ